MLYRCAAINIEYKWLCWGIGIYTGLRVSRGLSLVPQPAKMKDKPGWGRAGPWSAAALNPLPTPPNLVEAPSLSGADGLFRVREQWREEVQILQAAGEGTEKVSEARRSTALGPAATHGPLLLPGDHRPMGHSVMPWVLPLEESLGLRRHGEKGRKSYGNVRECLERVSGLAG